MDSMDVFEMVARHELTPEDGAALLMLRHDLQRARRPWWEKALDLVSLFLFGPVV